MAATNGRAQTVSNRWARTTAADRELLEQRTSTEVLAVRPVGFAIACPYCQRMHAVDRLGVAVILPCGSQVLPVERIADGVGNERRRRAR